MRKLWKCIGGNQFTDWINVIYGIRIMILHKIGDSDVDLKFSIQIVAKDNVCGVYMPW